MISSAPWKNVSGGTTAIRFYIDTAGAISRKLNGVNGTINVSAGWQYINVAAGDTFQITAANGVWIGLIDAAFWEMQ